MAKSAKLHLYLQPLPFPIACINYHLISASCQISSSMINVICLNQKGLVCGNTVFHETGPRCQKCWGPLA